MGNNVSPKDNMSFISNRLEEYTQGITFDNICRNELIFGVLQTIGRGELTEVEGLRLMVNMLADENYALNQRCSLFAEMISGKN
jgi:hypothetical protein